MERAEIKRIIEALLFASGEPLSIEELCEIFEGSSAKEIGALVAELRDEYNAWGRSFQIEEVAGGYQLSTHPDLSPWLKKLYRSRCLRRFSKPALETLAIVAYRQPITRAEVESIRGVNVEGLLKALLEKGMIRMKGRRTSPGRPIIYGTTNQFLEYFGLKSLDELPELSEIPQPEVHRPEEIVEEKKV